MQYRVEYTSVNEGSVGFGKKEFEAESDDKASSLVEEICQEAQTERNKEIKNRFFHFKVQPSRLVRIIQPEISEEIPIQSLVNR